MALSPSEVLGWAAEWVYVPDDARSVRTPRYHLVAYPETWADPTTVSRLDSDQAARALLDEVVGRAAGLGRSSLLVWVDEQTRPSGLVEELLARGAVLHEEVAVLARELSDPPELDVPHDVELRAVTDLDTQRDMDRVGVAVFGGRAADDDGLRRAVQQRRPDREAEWVAYLDGRPVGAAGLTRAGAVARLWGGGVLERARGRGVYRALLDRRLRSAGESGLRAALVTGRLATSAPILSRAGFDQYGERRGYRLRWD